MSLGDRGREHVASTALSSICPCSSRPVDVTWSHTPASGGHSVPAGEKGRDQAQLNSCFPAQ